MGVTTMSSREFNQDLARAKRSAKKGPVFVTNRGRRSFVLLSNEEYETMTRPKQSIADLLRMPEGSPDFEFEFPEIRSISPREVEFD